MNRYRSLIFLGLAVIISLFTSVMVFSWLRNQANVPKAEAATLNTRMVVVPTADLGWGTKLTPEMFQLIEYPKGSLPEGHFTNVDGLNDRVLLVDLKRNELLLESKLAPLDGKTGGVTAVTDPNKRAMNRARRGWMEHVTTVSNQGGAVAVMVAVTLPVLLGFAALTIDLGQALVARNELQDVADAAALAGARRVGTIYQSLTPAQQVSYTMTNPAPIYSDVQNVAALNHGAGRSITVDVGDIQIGQWNSTSKTFTAMTANPDAVRVTARLDGTSNGPVSTFLASVMSLATTDCRSAHSF